MPRAKKVASPAAEQPAAEDHSNIDENGKNDSAGVDEFVLPKATVTRLAKSVLPQNTQIQKDAMTAVSKSATVFVNYLTATANELTVQSGRRTINPNDVYQALEILELPFFLPRLKAEVNEFNKVATSKRQAKATASHQQRPQQRDQDEELAATKTAKVEDEDKAATDAEDEDGDQQNAKKASAAKRRAGKRAKTADGKAAVVNAGHRGDDEETEVEDEDDEEVEDDEEEEEEDEEDEDEELVDANDDDDDDDKFTDAEEEHNDEDTLDLEESTVSRRSSRGRDSNILAKDVDMLNDTEDEEAGDSD